MDAETYRRVREIYLAARELSGEARATFLAAHCADKGLRSEVDSLLLHSETHPGFLSAPLLGPDFALQDPESLVVGKPSPASSGIPERIGRYAVRGVLGLGGMGIVYLAEQESPRRSVALKLIQAGVATGMGLKRFVNEAQVLGRLHHPNIAQIYEAGTADTGRGPQPFFAMELIHGRSLTEHAAERGLGTREKLQILVKVARAVEHAHGRGVIHRDLKPQNILVDESGEPKVLDFGVARVIGGDLETATFATGIGQIVGTLPYMSPEQLSGTSGAVDTRSDVYSLGVIAYELLSGRLPLEIARLEFVEASRILRDEEPTPLSATQRVFRGDLETIVAKALEKDKGRRYAGAAEFAADLERYLRDEPIVARPASRVYQLRKFTRRNKALVGGVFAVFVALSAGMAATAWQAWRAIEQRNRARVAEQSLAREARKLAAVSRFQEEMLVSVDPGKDGREVRVAQVLDGAASEVESAFPGEPEIQAALRSTIGASYFNLGLYPEAEPHLVAALDVRRDVFGAEHADTLASMVQLARLRSAQDRQEEAEVLAREAYDARVRLLGREDLDTARAGQELASVLMRLHRMDEAEALATAGLAIHRRELGGEDRLTLSSMQQLARAFALEGRAAEAEPLLSEALALQRRLLQVDHPDTLATMVTLTQILQQIGRLDEAEALAREGLEAHLRAFGEDNDRTLLSLNNLAGVLRSRSRLSEAAPLMERALEVQERVLGANHRNTLASMNNLAALYIDLQQYTQAEEWYRRTLAGCREVLGEKSPNTALVMTGLSAALQAKGQLGEAHDLIQRALAILRETLPPSHPYLLSAINECAVLSEKQGDFPGAEALLLGALETHRAEGAENEGRIVATINLAGLLRRVGRLGQAELLYREALDICRRRLGPEHTEAARAMSGLASVLAEDGRASEAEALARDAVAIACRVLADDHWLLATSRGTLGVCLTRLGRFAEAEGELLRAHAALEGKPGLEEYVERETARLVELYVAWDKPEEARRWREYLASSPPADVR